MRLKLTRLDLSWSTSRGVDTYGYNIARLDDSSTGKRYRCNGGGYDMIGTVFGDWLEDVYQDRLLAFADRAACTWHKSTSVTDRNSEGMYGMTYYADTSKIILDGACGIECMIRIAEALGLSVQRTYNRKGHTTGYIVSEPEIE